MKDLLDFATVGDAYKTKGGRKAVITSKIEVDGELRLLGVETRVYGVIKNYFVGTDGIVCHGDKLLGITNLNCDSIDNLVEPWYDEDLHSQEVERLANNFCSDDNLSRYINMGVREIMYEAFIAGYNKAKENN